MTDATGSADAHCAGRCRRDAHEVVLAVQLEMGQRDYRAPSHCAVRHGHLRTFTDFDAKAPCAWGDLALRPGVRSLPLLAHIFQPLASSGTFWTAKHLCSIANDQVSHGDGTRPSAAVLHMVTTASSGSRRGLHESTYSSRQPGCRRSTVHS